MPPSFFWMKDSESDPLAKAQKTPRSIKFRKVVNNLGDAILHEISSEV